MYIRLQNSRIFCEHASDDNYANERSEASVKTARLARFTREDHDGASRLQKKIRNDRFAVHMYMDSIHLLASLKAPLIFRFGSRFCRFFNTLGLWAATSFPCTDFIRSAACQESRKQWRRHFPLSLAPTTSALNQFTLRCWHSGERRRSLLNETAWQLSFCSRTFVRAKEAFFYKFFDNRERESLQNHRLLRTTVAW